MVDMKSVSTFLVVALLYLALGTTRSFEAWKLITSQTAETNFPGWFMQQTDL